MKFSSWKKEKQQTEQVKLSKPTQDGLPAVYEAFLTKVQLSDWFRHHREEVLQELRFHGAVLFRRFAVNEVNDFETFVTEAIANTGKYVEGATPRSNVTEKVFTSTEFPSEQEIFLHNELSYVMTPPELISFFCVTPAQQGGHTQLADVRRVLALIDPEVITEFEQRGGWSLYRSFGFGMGPPIAKSFGTKDAEHLKHYCKHANIEILEYSDDRLKTRQTRPAVHIHPHTKEKIWFNHAVFWHPSNLPEELSTTLARSFRVEDFPFATFYGDGTAIPIEVIEHIRTAYKSAEVMFDWKKGDVLLIDNHLVAHGRKPFTGNRKVLVAMG
ncbi:MAG: TauD/TfdA family dioxygenase [Alteromonadaceae bacterium]|nr:TauD/TfdA family dioxygenase [Alteromonadaceae bacterium]